MAVLQLVVSCWYVLGGENCAVHAVSNENMAATSNLSCIVVEYSIHVNTEMTELIFFNTALQMF